MNTFDKILQDKLTKTLETPDIEFEIIFQGKQFSKNNTLQTFLNVIKRLQTLGLDLKENGTETLDIFLLNNNPIRVTLDDTMIKQFCTLNTLDEKEITNLIVKKTIKKKDLKEF